MMKRNKQQEIFRGGFISYISFGWIFPLLKIGKEKKIQQETALPFLEQYDQQEQLFQAFQNAYQMIKKRYEGKEHTTNLLFRTIISVHKQNLYLQFILAFIRSAVRISQPIFLHRLLDWLSQKNPPLINGLIWSLALSVTAIIVLLAQHQTFFIGMRTGFRTRQQAINIIYKKILNLNGQIIGDITSGKILNLVSNDARRFEEGLVFWPFLIISPLELITIFILVHFQTGFLPAFCGISTLLALIPLQACLSRQMSKIRASVAKFSDERVNLQSELISGIQSVKMLGWENPMMDKIRKIRKFENQQLFRMNMIRAFGVSLQFISAPLITFVTFAVFWAQGGKLILASVFSVNALLYWAQMTMALSFVKSVETCTELFVTLKRVNNFLNLPEPPQLNQQKNLSENYKNFENLSENVKQQENSIEVRGADFDWGSRSLTGTKTPKNLLQIQNQPKKITKNCKNGVVYHQLQENQNDLENDKEMTKISLKNKENNYTLKQVSFEIKRGELIGVCGKVGSGKSSLLAALLGEIQPVKNNKTNNNNDNNTQEQIDLNSAPKLRQGSTIAYCQQVPWIISGTVRENILFGQHFNHQFYDEVIDACALASDLEMLPAGDQTEIGERGINLSGGQKARLALARAAYSGASIQLLDDPLSAVDANVGKTLFNNCIQNIMKNSTRILVTHQRQYLPMCDRIFIMRNGKIIAQDTWENLNQNENNKYPELDFATEQNNQLKKDDLNKIQSFKSNPINFQTDKQNGNQSILVQKEKKQSGSVTWSTYIWYSNQIGLLYAILITLAIIGGQLVFLYSEYWLASWAQSTFQQNSKWLQIYGILVFFILFIGISRVALFSWRALTASGNIHDKMTKRVLRAPLKFFHQNPTGRILNRFSKDQGIVDEYFPGICINCFLCWIKVIFAFLLAAIAIPAILPLLFPLFYLFYRVRWIYVQTSREVKRYEAMTRSPVYSSFSQTLKGLPTIKAFQVQNQFLNNFIKELNLNGSWWFSFISISRWIGFRLDLIGAVLQLSCCLLTIFLKNFISPKLIALALSHVLQLSGLMQWAVRQGAELENNMTSVERLLEYTELDQEPPFLCEGGAPPPKNWPQTPSIKFENVVAAYRSELEPVLNDLSFEIKGGESVGIVGRTGSGKSSVLLTLFRLIDIRSGKIFLDGIDTSKIALDKLRRNIAVIPQDPVLFSGSVRSNLDPWKEYEDSALWQVLEAVQLKQVIGSGTGGLNKKMQEYGENLSVGQRQLFCLARALLENACVLALDEATANVDNATDQLIQQSIRKFIQGEIQTPKKSVEINGHCNTSSEIEMYNSEYSEKDLLLSSNQEKTNQQNVAGQSFSRVRSLIVIAHRIDTILDCDQLLVLDGGRLVENGSPKELQNIQNGAFQKMVLATK